MASVHKKKGSKYWFGAFTLPNGRRLLRSTKMTDRKRAQRIADEWDEAFRAKVAAKQSQRVITAIHKELTGGAIPNRSFRQYAATWMSAKVQETSKSTQTFYRAVIKSFETFLEGRSDVDLIEISAEEILAYRTSMAGVVSGRTINHRLKVLRMIFGQAKADGFITDNTAEAVKAVRDVSKNTRRPFTVDELRAILSVADDEWRSLILFGLYTGQRLGDLGVLTWQNIDTVSWTLRLTTRKTGRIQLVPIALTLREFVEKLDRPTDLKTPLHPRAFADIQKYSRASTISQDFHNLMARAGLVEKKVHRKGATTGPRSISEISFHSLRHTATSWLKESGAGSAVVQDIVGHESAAISQIYTHITDDAKREALNRLPRIG